MTNHPFARRAAAGALAAAALVVGGCGTDPKPDAGSGGTASQRADSAGVKFARCMRAHGVQIADPAPGSGGQLQTSRDDAQVSRTTMDQASKACSSLLPQQSQSSPGGAAAGASALKVARCLRSHGVDVADPAPGQPVEFGDGVDPSDPGVQKAQTACGMQAGSAPAIVGQP